jgi:hypothetical protein
MNPGEPFFNWHINVGDLIAILIAASVLYARLVAIETKLDPLWRWWNSLHRVPGGREDEAILVDRRAR